MAECATWLESYGGHALAAGISIRREQFEDFRRHFNAVAAEVLREVDLRPVQPVDAWVDLTDLNDELWKVLRSLRPFGTGHAEPVWAVQSAKVEDVRILKEKHLKLRVSANGVEMEAIGFNMAERTLPDGPVDLAFHLRKNTYRGQGTLQLQLSDFRASTA